MKRPVLILLTIISLTVTAAAQNYGWVDYRSKIPNFPNDTVYIGEIEGVASFTDVFFIDDNEGWITVCHYNNNTDSSTILHTVNGGESWEVQDVPSYCNAIWMLDKNTGYAGSQDGRIYKTTDGGNNWLFHSIPAGPIRDISFPPDSDIGYAVVEQSWFLFRIKPDTLERINLPNPTFWSSVTSPSVDNVWFVGGATAIYYDGNTTSYESIHTHGYLQGIWFHDINSGWASNEGYVSGYYEPTLHWIVIGTIPHGSTDICSVGKEHLWVVGFNGMLMNTHNASDFEHFPDGSVNVNVEWETPEHPYKYDGLVLMGVCATSETNAFVVGHDKAIMKYTEISGTGNELTETLQFEVFPNPATDKVKIKSSEFSTKNCQIELHDLHGKTLIKREISIGHEKVEIDVSNLAGGLYFCTLKTNKKSSTKKLIIE